MSYDKYGGTADDHQQAAFQGASSVRKPWPTPTEQQRMSQGRFPEEDSDLDNIAMSTMESTLLLLFIIALQGVFWTFVYWIYRSIFND